MNAILDLPGTSLFNLVKHAFKREAQEHEKEQDKHYWQLWCNLYPFMNIQLTKNSALIKYVSFKDFKENNTKKVSGDSNYTKKTFNEIKNEMNEVVTTYKGRG